MGLAASQARLLTITARLADNELRSQTINNAKMRLATQSAQASEKYVNALNQSDMMFQNTMLDGTSQNQLLTFNSLTAYSPYNTQYGLVNAAGLALVSEADANMFVASGGNCEKFLKLHGLEWQSTYFDHVNEDELKAAFGDDFGVIYGSIPDYGTEDFDLITYLRNAYENYDAYEGSLEYATFRTASQGFLTELSASVRPYQKWVLGENLDSNGNQKSIAVIIQELQAKFNSSGSTYSKDYAGLISFLSENLACGLTPDELTKILPNNPDEDGNRPYDVCSGSVGTPYATSTYETSISEILVSLGTPDATNFTYNGFKFSKESGSWKITNDETNYHPQSDVKGYFEFSDEVDGKTRSFCEIDGDTLNFHEEYQHQQTLMNVFLDDMINRVISSPYVYFKYASREGSYLPDLLETIFGPEQTSDDPNNPPPTNIDKLVQLLTGKGRISEITEDKDITELMQKLADITSVEGIMHHLFNVAEDGTVTPKMDVSPEFKNLMDMYRVDALVFVYGEPKYAWVDTKDTGNTGNPDTKAQWLTNLFERMKKGYRVLEDGLASSNDWIEYALQSGLVTLEQVDSSNRWINIDYKTCAGITEQTDRSAAVAKAEAEYNRAMNDIKQKDSIFDLQLKNIDTEHASLQQEYDSIQKVINKNIERTMKFDQNG